MCRHRTQLPEHSGALRPADSPHNPEQDSSTPPAAITPSRAKLHPDIIIPGSIRSFCSPGTMDSSGVMVLKLSQELWSSGVDLS
ncbi:hypothetical protein EYF80_001638 [Liparis tanakae]|uniref:Uncharacterized protein n=1 Tax=Liparis tanakae TaxID=230148 RepID=A0A4Z2JDK3_9TELE|nr:hypothetical protein EYF80_001638 [Liparis tanakae]